MLIQSTKSDLKQAINQKGKYAFDFSEVRGQENVKRALEIAAARRS